jgi:2-amino-4-hydroxy-6-hydroxymethyldihydropteridine diphosphokinase
MIILALGSNLLGAFGTPMQSLCRALEELSASSVQIKDVSRLYRTRAQASRPQPDFLNAIVTAFTPLPADALLTILKRIEAQAGRHEPKAARRWVPRPLDIDIVCYKGIICNWRRKKPIDGKRVVLPHPRAHERAFVLRPLSEAAPFWHHPVFGLTASEILKNPQVRETGAILGASEFTR